MELIKYSSATFRKNELIIDEGIDQNAWKELGQSLKQVEGSVQFWIGDWARFGDKKGFTGKRVESKAYDELEEITGLARQTLQDYKSVASSVQSSLRNEHLSYNHHKEVAKLPEAKQIEFLTRAVAEKLSVRKLRDQIRHEELNIVVEKLTPEEVEQEKIYQKRRREANVENKMHQQLRAEKLKKFAETINRKYTVYDRRTIVSLINIHNKTHTHNENNQLI